MPAKKTTPPTNTTTPAAKAPAKKAASKAVAAKAPAAKTPAAKAPAKKAAAQPVEPTVSSKPAPAPKAAKQPSPQDIAQAAYLNYLSRKEKGEHGDSHGDWLAAERKLKGHA